MSSSESDHDTKKTYPRLEPLCLFCCPRDGTNRHARGESRTVGNYENNNNNNNRGTGESERVARRRWAAQREKQEMWLRRRTEVSMKRKKRIFEGGRNLKSYLLTSVRPIGGHQKLYAPFLVEALETVKDAWAPKKALSLSRCFDDTRTTGKRENQDRFYAMTECKPPSLPTSSRRSSMPEEFMRKYFLKKMIPSEESETNQTVPDGNSESSKDPEEEGGVREPFPEEEERNDEEVFRGRKCAEIMIFTNDGEESPCSFCERRSQRVTQRDYENQGKGIIKPKRSDTNWERFSRGVVSPGAKDEGEEESQTSESWNSSSPVELARQDFSTSGNLSSESDEIKCTCAEMSSKETSIDMFRSGNSTLSQSVSEKSLSTQDSTVSIHSVSTGGSTFSPNSNSSSPEIFARTSAKESSSPDQTHRDKSKRNPQCTIFHYLFRRRYPKYLRRRPYCRKHYRRRRVCYEIEEEKEAKDESSGKENCEGETGEGLVQQGKNELDQMREAREGQFNVGNQKCEWVKYTPEEIYMMQQMRHRKLMENSKRFSIPLPESSLSRSISVCAAKGSVYEEVEEQDDRLLVPRYSALPRTLSMLVNTSSGDTSAINSDSDTLSLADSLEEFPVAHVHRISYDTKKELKPVRGDVNAAPEQKKTARRRHPRPKAFFVSIKEPYGEDDLLAGISKIPEPPEKIKERIDERQLNISRLRKKNLERRRAEAKKRGRCEQKRRNQRSREARHHPKREDTSPGNPQSCEGSHRNCVRHSDRKFEKENTSPKAQTQNSMDRKARNASKKKTVEKSQSQMTMVSESKNVNAIQDGKEEDKNNQKAPSNNSLSKPQAVIHPSQMPTSEPEYQMRKIIQNQSRAPRFRQKFEAIPEEKSSSMSSTEENKTIDHSKTKFLPVKMTEHSETDKSDGAKYTLGHVSNLVFAKVTGRSLEACMNKGTGTERPIILLSPKPVESGANSRKGKDTLIALNREDFTRLTKGWMNFYVMKEASDASESGLHEDVEVRETQQEKKGPQPEKSHREKNGTDLLEKKVETPHPTGLSVKKERQETKHKKPGLMQRKTLNESVRLNSSSTILTPINVSPRKPKRLSLPELKLTPPSAQNSTATKDQTFLLPKMTEKNSECDGMDSDSTVYCPPPSSIVPRLAFCDSSDSLSDSSPSNSDSRETTTVRPKPGLLRKRSSSQRGRLKKELSIREHRESKGCPGWSVTVAGTLELTNSAPDLEMRLSFPGNGCGQPQPIHSDSGFTEEASHSLEPSKETFSSERRKEQRWTVTVQNPKQGHGDGVRRRTARNPLLPELGGSQSRNSKKVAKSKSLGNEITNGKISIYWPTLEIRRDEYTEDIIEDEELTVKGNAVPMEKKPRPPTMTERDLTRGSTARSLLSESKKKSPKK